MDDCCKEVKGFLGDYLDGDLDPDLCRELHQHLNHCDPCRVVVDTTRQTIRFYCDRRPVDLPEDIASRLFERLRKETR